MLSDSSDFPGREFSRQILTGAWPDIDSTDLRLQGQQEAQAAREVREAAEESRRVADEFMQIGAGRFTDATHRGYMSDGAFYDAKADFHDAYDKTLVSAGDKVDSAKSRLEHIDWEAHDKISQMRQAGSSTAALENVVIAAARTAALAHATAVGAEIAGMGKDLAGHKPPLPGEHEIPGSAHLGPMYQQDPYVSSPDDDHVFAAGNGTGSDDAPPTRGGPDGKPTEAGAGHSGEQDPSTGPGGEHNDANPDHAGGPGDTDSSPLRGEGRPTSGGDSVNQSGSGLQGGPSPLTGLPGAGGGSPGGGSGGGSGLMGGGSSGLSSAFQSGRGVPAPGGSGLGSGPGSGGLGGLSQGVGSPGGGSAGGAPVNPAGEFARNFSAAAMSSPPPSVPPPAAPASPPAGAGAPGGGAGVPGSSAGPAAAPGSVAPAVSPTQGVIGGAAPPPPPSGGAGLAPVGSEVARQVGGSPAPATAPAGGPTPAGVAASGASGAAGGAATASMTTGLDPTSRRRDSHRGHEVIPDEHLSTAIQLVYELMYGSRHYDAGIEWCVGVFVTPGGSPEIVVTSNEGASYVPAGVFLPRPADLLFADPVADTEFREKWFGRANPVATMVAYAELRRGEDGTLPLHAVAASALMTEYTNLGPAEEAGVQHVHLCDPDNSPFKGTARGDQVLDTAHMHRLELVDKSLLRWLREQDRSMGELVERCGRLTTAAFEAVSGRLGDSGLMVPDIGAGIYSRLEYSGGEITNAQWSELHAAIRAAEAESGALRPPDDSSLAAAMYRPRHDLARLLELLYWWKPQGPDRSILFMEIAYAARQLVDSE